MKCIVLIIIRGRIQKTFFVQWKWAGIKAPDAPSTQIPNVDSEVKDHLKNTPSRNTCTVFVTPLFTFIC